MLNESNKTGMIVMDLSQEFDTVNHKELSTVSFPHYAVTAMTILSIFHKSAYIAIIQMKYGFSTI